MKYIKNNLIWEKRIAYGYTLRQLEEILQLLATALEVELMELLEL